MPTSREQAQAEHDHHHHHPTILHRGGLGDDGDGGGGSDSRQVWVPGPVIVGAGPSGLATAACLKARGVPSLVLEKDSCVAASWRHRTYERLRLHLPRCFCELPLAPFPPGTPPYPTRDQFIAYLDDYARAFGIEPRLGARVRRAAYDAAIGFWRVTVDEDAGGDGGATVASTEFLSRWLVVATGENAEPAWPEGVEGMDGYRGVAMHTSSYKKGDEFRGKNVLVVGCGNSGMEVSLDLCNNGAKASMVVRDKIHVLPREILGISTFGLSVFLLRWLPIRQVVPAIQRFTENGVEFIDGHREDFDAVIFATGYKSNVPSWLKEEELFSHFDGFPRKPFPHSWRGKNGLYAAGFTKKGLMGTSYDALRIAGDIADQWTETFASPTATNRSSDHGA
ncbi:indole-3-pyruvate monooxygenase YUCCA6 isoform X2 [Sorghum bicolor]|uniref:indole-3-pyruvate monooxygenase YUCCA6 isoform X2 n=1 Tax=Sorghum bicolor TaxID=4558 RepID=UPI000B4257F1|nr:indole-3-pyruvate monooxygenase YUCCA6 isoform X2 [Sorghum bicolor]|eukprot:XP_021301614.1 indole-3-pyruvate monooxygenase YUCCA6 isoform X2 [Sorghum bicolor]